VVLVFSAVQSRGAGPGEGVFIHIKSGPEEAHSVLMALQMANLMAEEHPVLVYVDVAGVEVLTKEAPNLERAPFTSSKEAIEGLLKKGVPVLACQGCLKTKGIDRENLLEGIQIAHKEAFFDFCEGRILSLTY
jgi:predicted peroxiredoxin